MIQIHKLCPQAIYVISGRIVEVRSTEQFAGIIIAPL